MKIVFEMGGGEKVGSKKKEENEVLEMWEKSSFLIIAIHSRKVMIPEIFDIFTHMVWIYIHESFVYELFRGNDHVT